MTLEVEACVFVYRKEYIRQLRLSVLVPLKLPVPTHMTWVGARLPLKEVTFNSITCEK